MSSNSRYHDFDALDVLSFLLVIAALGLAAIFAIGCSTYEPDSCLDSSTALIDGASHDCTGARGCSAFDERVYCDEQIVTDGAGCITWGQVWCSVDEVYICGTNSQWHSIYTCNNGCMREPMRCMP